MNHHILPGRNIRIEYLPHACRIHSVPGNSPAAQGSGEYLAEFQCDRFPSPAIGDLVMLSYGENVFKAAPPARIDPLYYGGDERILAQIVEIETQGTMRGRGKARISGAASVSLASAITASARKGRRFLLPDGSGGWVFSKRGGALLLPATGGRYNVSLGPLAVEPNLYTGPFTVDFNEAGTEFLVYDSGASPSSVRAGVLYWGAGSYRNVPRMSRAVGAGIGLSADVRLYAGWTGSGDAMIFSLSGIDPSQVRTGVETVRLATAEAFQLQRGDIYMPWRV